MASAPPPQPAPALGTTSGPGLPGWTGNLTSTVPTPGPAGWYYADVPNRIIAFLVDSIVLSVIDLIVVGFLGLIFGGIDVVNGTTNGQTHDLNLLPWLLALALNGLINVGYFVLLWSRRRATIGMQVLGLQIGDEADGRNIRPDQGLIRAVVIGIPLVLLRSSVYAWVGLGVLMPVVGAIWLLALMVSIAQSPTKQGYHDKVAHTIMVKAARRAV
ncbi:MAG: RDD family protein [Chloroflexota bacterium]